MDNNLWQKQELPPVQQAELLQLAQLRQELLHQIIPHYLERQKYLEQLQLALASNHHYLVVFAPAGMGKSAFLAKFIQDWNNQNSPIPLAFHFITNTGISHELHWMLMSLADQLYQAGLLQQPPAADTVSLRRQIRRLLETSEKPLLVVIDALDQLEEAGKDLSWLPRQLAPSVKIILSTQPTRPWDQLQTYNELENLNLQAWNAQEIHQFIQKYQAEYGVQMDFAEEELLRKKSSGNPLYLTMALSEIQAGHIKVKELALSSDRLLELTLERLYEQFGQHVIQDYLGLLIASRDGLSEQELFDLLAQKGSKDYPPLAEELFYNILQAFQHLLVSRQGLLHFFHHEFNRFAQQRLGKFSMRSYHRRLALYFQSKSIQDSRFLYEVVYQCQFAEQYTKVLFYLSNLEFLEAKCQAGMLGDLIADFERALYHPQAAVPDTSKLCHETGCAIQNNVLQIFYQALVADQTFLTYHPQGIFQSLWNHCLFYDHPEIGEYYEQYPSVAEQKLPQNKIRLLLEHWYKSKSQKHTAWLQSQRPLPNHLETWILHRWQEHDQAVTAVAVNLKGTMVASASRDHAIALHHLETGKFLRCLTGHTREVLRISFSPDGTTLASAGADHEVRLWQVKTGDCLNVLKAHTQAVTMVCFSHDGRRLITAGQDRTIRVWDTIYGRNLFTIQDNLPEVAYCLTTADNKRIVAAFYDGTIRSYALETGTMLQSFAGHDTAVRDLAISYDQTLLISAGQDKTVRIWDYYNQKCLQILSGHELPVTTVDIRRDGSLIISGSEDGTIRLWQTKDGENIKTFGDHRTPVTNVCFSPDGQKAVAGLTNGQVLVLDLTGNLPQLHGQESAITAVQLDMQSRWIVTGYRDHNIGIWTQQGKLTCRLQGHNTAITALGLSDNGQTFASAEQGLILIWDMPTNKVISKIEIGHHFVNYLTFAHSQPWLAAGGSDGTIHIYHLETAQLICSLQKHNQKITAMAFDSKDEALVSGSSDHTVKVWDLKQQKESHIFPGHQDVITSVGFSPDRLFVYSSAHDNTTRKWDLTQPENSTIVLDMQTHVSAWSNSQFRYYTTVQNRELVVFDKTTNQPLAWFPACLHDAKINPQGLIVAHHHGNYLYVLQLMA